MHAAMLFALVYGIVVVTFLAVMTVIPRWDRIVVWLMRVSQVHLYPLAINIAIMIERHPDQWNSDKHHLSHPKIGSIWISNESYGLHVETPFGNWTPNKLERRIIYNAVEWRLKQYIRDRLAVAMQANHISHG